MLKKVFLLNLFLILMVCLASCNSLGGLGKSRQILNKDVCQSDVIVSKVSNGLYFSFIVRPQVDIEGLYICFCFYDKDNYPIISYIEEIGKVVVGNEYHVEIGSTFSAKELAAISNYNYFPRGRIFEEYEYKLDCSEHEYDNGYLITPNNCFYGGQLVKTCKKCGIKDVSYMLTVSCNFVKNKYSSYAKYICSECCVFTN